MGSLSLVRRKGLFGITWGVPGAETWQSSRDWSAGLTLGTPDSLTKPYAQHSTVATALSIFVDDAAGVGWELYPENKSKDDDPIESHQLLDALKRPSTMFSGHQMWVGSYLSRRLFGAFAWYYPKLSLGNPGGLKATQGNSGEILVLDPRRMFRREGSWWLRVLDGEMKLDERYLTICARWSPYEPGKWLSEIDAVLIEIQADHAAAQYNRAFFRDQFGLPVGLLIPNETSTNAATERDDFVKRFNETAASRRRTVGSVPPGWKWQDLGVSMKDMDFRQLREYARELILAAIGVPPFMAGVLDKANYANAREQREMYWMGPQTRFLAEVQACLNHDFLPKLGVKGVELYPCWEKVKALLENLAEKVEVATKLFAMGVPIRQINDRLELGLEIDDLDTADTGFLPFNLVPVEQVLNPPEPMALPASDSPEDDDGKAPVPSKRLALVTRDEAKRATQWRTIVARARDVEMRFNTTLRKHFHAIEREVLENLNGIKGWQAKQKWPNKATTADLVFNPREAKAALIAVTAPLQKIAVVRGADSVLGDLAADVSFSVTDPAVIGKLAELSHKITRIDSTIEAALGESLSQGLNAGESIGQLSERVRNVMQATRARSMAIARTETGFAFNTGRYEGMKQAGIERQEWLTARDTSVRESHASIDGQVVMLGEPFTLGSGVTILYPLDPSGPASEVINCRCVAVPVIGG